MVSSALEAKEFEQELLKEIDHTLLECLRMKGLEYRHAMENYISEIRKEWVVHDVLIVTGKTGHKQECDNSDYFDTEWCDQSCGHSGDDYSGYLYIHVAFGKYVRIAWWG